MPVRGRCARILTTAGLLLAASAAHAKVTPAEAAALGQSLTPVGAQAAGNADGSIPEWRGGLTAPPECFAATARYCDPFAGDKPLATISSGNLEAWRDRLSPGQRALFARYPDSYRMNVYPTRRGFANPALLYEGAVKNAVAAELSDDALAIRNAVAGTPFPIPKTGVEAAWNHRLRWRGEGWSRTTAQVAVNPTGEFQVSRVREDQKFPFVALLGAAVSAERDLLQVFLPPARAENTVVLLRERLDEPKEALRAWQYSPGEKRVRKAPGIGYDGVAPGTENLRTVDQDDVLSGPLDRYDFKLVGKREMVVPANSYALHMAPRYKDVARARHINQDLARYELRRVWVVEATLKKGLTHLYRRRTLFLDEDGWQARVVDVYDGQGELWRVQEGHTVEAYDRLAALPVCETVYDLLTGRYLAQALGNEEPEAAAKLYEDGYFDVSNASRQIAR